MTRRYRVEVLLALMSLSGCGKVHSGETLGLREPKGALAGHPGSTGRIDAGSSEANQAVMPSWMPKDAAIAEPDAAGTMLATGTVDGGSPTGVGLPSSEVWIGQLRSDGPTLCDLLDALPQGSSIAFGNGPSIERAVLILQQDTAGLSGQIQFGQGMPPEVPDFNDSKSLSFWKCSREQLSKGFEYTLVAPVLTSERLTFAIVPNEIWDTWCSTLLDPCTGPTCEFSSVSCSCRAGTCRANQSNRFTVSLAVTARTIEGVLPVDLYTGGTSVEVRLRRAQ